MLNHHVYATLDDHLQDVFHGLIAQHLVAKLMLYYEVAWRACAGHGHVLRSFFFASRRRHTRCLSDWSSDVCSSDLGTSLITAGSISNWLREIEGTPYCFESSDVISSSFTKPSFTRLAPSLPPFWRW